MKKKRSRSDNEVCSDVERQWVAATRSKPKTSPAINTLILVIVLAALCVAAYLGRAHRCVLAAGDRQGPAGVGNARETGARRPGNRRPGLLDQLTPVTSEFRARSVGHGPPRPVQVCRTGPRHRGTTQEIPRHRQAVRFLAESRPLNMQYTTHSANRQFPS